VVVKMLEPVVAHKARVGGVRLGVRTGHDLDAALDAIDAAGARRYLIEETIAPGLDLIVGARRDPLFGPLVILGLGGDAAEALDAVVVHPAPLPETAAAAMIDELLGPVTAAGLRGAGLSAAITSLGALLAAVPEISELEINPLRVTADGRLMALDVVISSTGEGGTLDNALSVSGQGGL
jgi:acetyltransferase